MEKLIIFAIIGFLAQLIDGSLGMAYGVSSTSFMLAFGITPVVASSSVHLAEVVTTAASGISHIKFGNVDRQTVFKLIIPGSIGAFIGACFLSNLPGEIIKPYISIFLLVLGVYVLLRFLFKGNYTSEKKPLTLSRKQSISMGLVAGFADAIGGGGWGPITTPILLSRKGISPRKVIGTVDTSEFAVAVSASLGFLISIGWEQVNWIWVISLMLGGVLAAPIAAWLVSKLPSHLLGVTVGGFIILTNINTLSNVFPIMNEWISFIYFTLFIGWTLAIIFIVRNNKSD